MRKFFSVESPSIVFCYDYMYTMFQTKDWIQDLSREETQSLYHWNYEPYNYKIIRNNDSERR